MDRILPCGCLISCKTRKSTHYEDQVKIIDLVFSFGSCKNLSFVAQNKVVEAHVAEPLQMLRYKDIIAPKLKLFAICCDYGFSYRHF